ncbi:MAG: DUF3365 domain-containing protein [Chromatocurvus sp.]
MMNTLRGAMACLAMISAAGSLASTDRAAIETEAKNIVEAFVGEVKPMLQGYMQTLGPVGAVEGCAVEAPDIADRMSDRTGWEVGRVSLKPRNIDRGTPDAWEVATLQQLEAKRREGAGPGELNHGEWIDGRYRYMQAQVVDAVCLNCHGKSLDPAVKASIDKYYPDDSATGYSLGDIRGAVTLASPSRD